LRAEPELRREAEEVLHEGESLSAFVEEAIRRSIEDRKAQALFVRKGLASARAARKSGKYVEASVVLGKLEQRLRAARAEAHPRSKAIKRS
jgi:hypothetical protein